MDKWIKDIWTQKPQSFVFSWFIMSQTSVVKIHIITTPISDRQCFVTRVLAITIFKKAWKKGITAWDAGRSRRFVRSQYEVQQRIIFLHDCASLDRLSASESDIPKQVNWTRRFIRHGFCVFKIPWFCQYFFFISYQLCEDHFQPLWIFLLQAPSHHESDEYCTRFALFRFLH